jgi:hypothetical protein
MTILCGMEGPIGVGRERVSSLIVEEVESAEHSGSSAGLEAARRRPSGVGLDSEFLARRGPRYQHNQQVCFLPHVLFLSLLKLCSRLCTARTPRHTENDDDPNDDAPNVHLIRRPRSQF